MERKFTHKVIGSGLSEYYQETAEAKHCGTEAECKEWLSKQEHPEYLEVTYSTEEFKRRNLLRKLTGEAEPRFITEREEVMIGKFLEIESGYRKRLDKSAESAADFMEDFSNNYNCPMTSFIELMTRKHRTLQQTFTKLCLKWIEKVASPEYTYDGRNEASHKQCKRLLDNWKLKHPDDGIHMDKEMLESNPPSKWLNMV